jgi:Holliday junction resolvase RusA-like endonuclease
MEVVAVLKFTIPLPPVTKKNHQQIIINKATGRPIVIPSKQYKQYEKECGWFVQGKGLKINEPVNVKCVYYMPTRRRVDLTNLMEATHDILVKYEVLEDDNSKIIRSVDGSRVLYDKENPRTEITIERAE